MMSFPFELALWLTLAATGGMLFAVHQRLRTAGTDLAEYRRALADVIVSLAAAEKVVSRMTREGREVAIVLADRVAAAEALLGRREPDAASSNEKESDRCPTPPSPTAEDALLAQAARRDATDIVEEKLGGTRNLDTILRIPVTVQVVLGTASMPVANLMKLGRGAVVPLDHRIGDPVDVVVNGRVIARGEVVVLEEDNSRFGVSLTEIAGPQGRTSAD